MNTFFRFFVLMVIASSIVFNGCKKDDKSNASTTPTYTKVLTATIGGVAFSASLPMSQMSMGNLQISGTNAAGALQIILPYNVGTGTITVTEDSPSTISWTSGQNAYVPGTGTIIITKHDVTNNIIEGTFSANLKEFETNAPLQITNGVFKITYVEQ
ncbi:MAG TPA: DUF6252 family protein [Bacteroidales bacterium]|nr:hypothetical protein [Bacteroidales bacterium]HNV96620.1 DUF6252 family protein [Bacteroidales bacterium]